MALTAQCMRPDQDSEDSFEVLVVAALPSNLTEHYGAPAQIWFYISSPAASDRLLYDVLWVNKTATRLPEARLAPRSRGSDEHRMHTLLGKCWQCAQLQVTWVRT